jgi:hypothetical protein
MNIYAIPNPAFIEAAIPDSKVRVMKVVGYDLATDSFIEGPLKTVTPTGKGYDTRIEKGSIDEQDVFYDNLAAIETEVKLSPTNGILIDAHTTKLLMNVSAYSKDRSAETFADSDLADIACAPTYDPPTEAELYDIPVRSV